MAKKMTPQAEQQRRSDKKKRAPDDRQPHDFAEKANMKRQQKRMHEQDNK